MAPAIATPSSKHREIVVEKEVIFPAAGCDRGTPVSNWELPKTNSPRPVCLSRGLPDSLPDRVAAPGDGAGYELGTIVVLSVSKEKVIVAADSRATLVRGGQIVGFADTACKLLELNPKLLFAVTGMAATRTMLPADVQFDAAELAKQAARNFCFDARWMEKDRTVVEIAAKWGWDVDFRIRRGVTQGWLRPIGPMWLEGIFAGLEPNGEITVAVARLTYQKPRPGFVVPSAQLTIERLGPPRQYTWIEAYGLKKVAETYYSSRLTTDKTKSEWRRIHSEQLRNPKRFGPIIPTHLAELTIRQYEILSQQTGQPKLVNGPVDVAVLSRKKGVRWLRRKPNCGASR
jgi:hypothetical protein